MGLTGQREHHDVMYKQRHNAMMMSRYNIFIKTRLGEDWEVREVIVPPVAKHNVEKVKEISLSAWSTILCVL